MAAFDMDDPQSIVSPGGVGFDINCGVRLLRTNLFEKDVQPIKVNIIIIIIVFRCKIKCLQVAKCLNLFWLGRTVYMSNSYILLYYFILGAISSKHV